MIWGKTKPLLHCEIMHQLPGRVRIGCRALRYLGAQSKEIRQRLEDLVPVCHAQVSTITENVLVSYDPLQATRDDIVEQTESVLGGYSLLAYKAERLAQDSVTVNERRLQEEPISEMLVRIGVTTATLGYPLLSKRAMKSPATLLGRFLTLPALTALSLALPILRSGWNSLAARGRPNADTLSATAILASILAGRGWSALTIIWLADIAELLTAYTMGRTRRAIRAMLSVGEDIVWRVREDGTEQGVDLTPMAEPVQRLARTGESIVYVADDHRLLGILGVQDSLRENMKKAINRLRHIGMDDIILLTGDVEQHAQIVASRMSMDRYEAEVLPDNKAETGQEPRYEPVVGPDTDAPDRLPSGVVGVLNSALRYAMTGGGAHGLRSFWEELRDVSRVHGEVLEGYGRHRGGIPIRFR